MRILYLHTSGHIGGAERSLLVLIEALLRQGVEVGVVTRGGGPFVARLKGRGVRTFVAHSGWRCGLLYELAVRRALSVLRPEVVHLNQFAVYAQLRALDRLALPEPVVIHCRDLKIHRPHRRARIAPGVAKHFICISRAVRDALLATGYHHHYPVEVIHNAVDGEALFPDPAAGRAFRACYGVPAEAMVVGMVGRVDWWKGQDILLRASAMLGERLSHRLLVVGDSSISSKSWRYRVRLARLIRSLGLAGRLTRTGFSEDLRGAFCACDLVCVPSLREPFGRTVIEAMACGRAVVASRAGGIPEIITDGADGVLVPIGDAEALAGAIEALAADPGRRQRLGEAARDTVQERFSAAAQVERFLGLYQRILGP